MNVFIVFAYKNYEGSADIVIFRDKNTADKLAEICNLYQAAKPELIDSDESDEAFDKLEADQDIWEESHPARKYSTQRFNYYDGYSVSVVLFAED